MFGKKRDREWELERKRMAARREDWVRDEERAAELFRRAHELKKCEQSDLPRMAMALFRDAQHELGRVRQSIIDRTKYKPLTLPEEQEQVGDMATYVAEDLVEIIRDHHTNPQTVFQAMSDQFPGVHFTIDYYDAATLIAANIREERLIGLVEGLEPEK